MGLGLGLDSPQMLVLSSWLHEHTVEDVLLSRTCGKTVHRVDRKDTLRSCLERFVELRIHNLLIQEPDSPDVVWVRLKDALKVCYAAGSAPASSLDEPIDKVNMGLCGPTVAVDKPIAALLARWEACSTWIPPVLLTKTDSQVIGVLTAADLFHYVHLYGSRLYSLVDNKSSLIAFDENLSLLSFREPAAAALQLLLRDDSLGIVGLVNDKGALVDSATLHAFLPLPGRLDLDQPILEYLGNLQHRTCLVTCSDLVSFGQILQKILHHDAHHLWKLNEFHRPVGVISHTHLIRFIKSQAGIN